jgi:pantoate--beta-alanine ligase
MSSRNAYLNRADREAATVINRALRAGAAMISAGETDPGVVARHVASVIEAEPLATPGYAEVVDPASLETPMALVPGATVRLLATALFGSTRLLDNLEVPVP